MFLGNSFGRTMDILHRTMDVNLMRQDVIANNIANADTPDFKRGAVNFEAELSDALRSQREQPRFTAAQTHEDTFRSTSRSTTGAWNRAASRTTPRPLTTTATTSTLSKRL